MTKALKTLMALGAGGLATVLLAACGSSASSNSIPSGSVATVAGNPITTQAFNHWMYVAAKSQAAQSPGQPVIVPTDPPQFTQCIANVKKAVPSLAKQSDKTLRGDCQQLFTSLSSQVMDFLIKAYWYQADAARQGLKVTNAQVQKAYNQAKQQAYPTDSAFKNFLSQTGFTVNDLVFRFRVSSLFQKLAAKHTTKVTPATIQAYYNSHKSQFGKPESRDIRIVLTKTQAQAQAAKKALSSGQSWTAVAKKYSTDPSTKNKGGQLTGVTKGQEDKALDSAAFAAKTNKVLGPIKGQFGYYVFEVTKITKATQQSLAQATPLIQQTLTRQQQTSAQGAVDKVAKKYWLSKTQCKTPYAMADCSGYKAPKTSTTPGAAAPGAAPTPGATSTPGTTSSTG
jgi:foldase protein PrsA